MGLSARPGDDLAGLREILRATRPDADVELIRRAYDVAASWHQGQTRKSGDPYITHPLAVATILVGTGADDEMLCAALLHDTIEDTPCTLAALSGEFGAAVAALVTGTAALDRIRGARGRTLSQVMAAAKSADARVLAIKLADRLHNMRTVQFIPQVKQLRKARELLDIFVPVAAQLSMDMIEAELETLAYATMKPTGTRVRHRAACSSRWPRCSPQLPASVVRGMAWRTTHAARPARPGSLRDPHRARHPAAGVHGAHARLGTPAVRLVARMLPRPEPLPAAGCPATGPWSPWISNARPAGPIR